jgi:hypothetical protein
MTARTHPMPETHSRRPLHLALATLQRWSAGIAAVLGFIATLYLFYPGFMSWDSTHQFHQSITGNVENPHPPMMAYLWMLTNRIVYGPGGMLFVQSAAYWTGLALIASHVTRSAGWRAGIVLALGFFPPSFGLLSTIWKDVGVLAFTLLALGLVLHQPGRRSRWWIAAAIVSAFYATAVRGPVLLSMLPLFWLISDAIVSRPAAAERGAAPRRLRSRTLAFVVLAASFAAGIYTLNNVGVKRLPYRASVPLWDLAMISLQRDELLIPPYAIHVKDFDLQRLKRITRRHRCNFHAPEDGQYATPDLDYSSLSQDEANRLLLHWIETILEHPVEYSRHRAWVTSRVFHQPELKFYRWIMPLPHFVPRVDFLPRPGYASVLKILRYSAETPLYVPWVYLLIAVAALLASFFAPGYQARAARCVSASAILYVAPLPVIAPSTDFRYSIWVIAGSLVACLLLGAAWKQERGAARRRDAHAKASG